MSRRLIRLCAAVFGLILVGVPAAASNHCPDFLIWTDGFTCSRVSGTSCSNCKYYCDDGNTYNWNVCEPTDDGGG